MELKRLSREQRVEAKKEVVLENSKLTRM